MMWLMLYSLSLSGRKETVGRLEARQWLGSVSSTSSIEAR